MQTNFLEYFQRINFRIHHICKIYVKLLTKCASTDGIIYAWTGSEPSMVLFIAIRMFSTIFADVSGLLSGLIRGSSLFKKLYDIEKTFHHISTSSNLNYVHTIVRK